MARYVINCDFLENIRQRGGTGKYQEYADAALRGFGVKVTPQGSIAYYFWLTQPNGRYGARLSALSRTRAERRARAGRNENAKRARVVPTVGISWIKPTPPSS
ncbi:hypothetical protein [uncultured Paraburkholderia sp.]|uniref:hypothetical protein n=1 Tax=uncultured Paraburkholderia sp. TaxID=1822466 RepID=UPI002594AFCA|nr:hypothetical protein [uncultured Paraburkholderia sp.]